MNNISDIARQTIPKGNGIRKTLFPNGDTEDIIKAIMYADKRSAAYTKKFSESLKGLPVREVAKKAYDLVMKDINYILDGFGVQDVKSPAQTFTDGFADCKSISVLINSIFKNLGFPYRYRFVSYDSGSTKVSHVYSVVTDEQGREIIVDPVYEKEIPDKGGFNKEKAYKFKKDYMTKISYISGPGAPAAPARGQLVINKPIDEMNEAEMDLLIRKQAVEIQQNIIDGIRGTGNYKSEKFQDELDAINDVLGVIQDDSMHPDEKVEEIGMIEEDAENGHYNTADEIHVGSIGALKAKRAAKKVENKKHRKEKKATKKATRPAKKVQRSEKRKKFFKKVGEKVKKGLKAVTKIATLPGRLFVKGLLEVSLPKMAPFFLYLFVPDSSVTKLSPRAQTKRVKAMKLKHFIVSSIGMKEEHFMGIVRNGIMKKYNRSPEAVINKMSNGGMGLGEPVNGVGAVDEILDVVFKVIKKIGEIFKKKKPDDLDITSDDAPSESDFADMAPEEKRAMNRDMREKNQFPTELDHAEGNSAGEDAGSDEGGNSNGGGRKGIC